MAFDLASLEVSDEFTVDLLSPADEPIIGADGKQASVTVYGPGSKQYARAQARRSRKMVERMSKGKGKVSADDQVRDQAEFLADCTKSINGLGSIQDVVGFYSNTRLGYIAEQVSRGIGDWANFWPGSAKS